MPTGVYTLGRSARPGADHARRTVLRGSSTRVGRPLCIPRDDRGRFVKPAAWWRPRDEYGRFLSQGDIELLAVGAPGANIMAPNPPRRDPRGRFAKKKAIPSNYYARMPIQWTNVTQATSPTLYLGTDPAFTTGPTYVTVGNTTSEAINFVWDDSREANFTGYTRTAQPLQRTFERSITYQATTTQINAFYQVPQTPAGMILTHRCTDAEFEGHPDPDALLGEIYDSLRRRLEGDLMTKYGLNVDEVWQQWTMSAGTTLEDSDEFGPHWNVVMRADWGKIDQTSEAWQKMAALPQPMRSRALTPSPPTAEEVRQQAVVRKRNECIARTRTRTRDLRKRVASRKADVLLREVLSTEQRADLDRANGFKVHTPSGNVYWVARGVAGNVHLLDATGRKRTRYCAHGPSILPDGDHMVSQMLMLVTDEPEFLRIANASPSDGRQPIAA